MQDTLKLAAGCRRPGIWQSSPDPRVKKASEDEMPAVRSARTRTDTDEVGGIHKDSRDRLRRRRPEGQHPLGEHAVEMRLQCDPAGSIRVETMIERASRCIIGPLLLLPLCHARQAGATGDCSSS